METILAERQEDLQALAKEILLHLKQRENAQIVGLSGDLGSGKTALTKAFAKELGVAEEVTSPTFVVMKSYEINNHEFYKKLVHIDAYRIEDEEEMKVLRFEEIINDPTNLVFIEWPEQIQNTLPRDVLSINLKILEGETREITYGS